MFWCRSLLFGRKRRFWVHTHSYPMKLDLLRNRIGRRLASENKHQPRNTLGQARSGSVRRAVWMLPFHNVGLFSKPNRFGSARLGWQYEWGLCLCMTPIRHQIDGACTIWQHVSREHGPPCSRTHTHTYRNMTDTLEGKPLICYVYLCFFNWSVSLLL